MGSPVVAATDLSAHTGVLPDGAGVGTDDQAVPFQFSAAGAALAVAGPPTTQASVSERAYDPVSSAPAVEAGGVTTVQPAAADAGTVSPSSPAVIPASVHNRETRIMKIPSSGYEEHACHHNRPQTLTFFKYRRNPL
jgi:hypothetical protein